VQCADENNWMTDVAPRQDKCFKYALLHNANGKLYKGQKNWARKTVETFLSSHRGILEGNDRRKLIYHYWTLLCNIWQHQGLIDKSNTRNYLDLWQLAERTPLFLPQAASDMNAVLEKAKLDLEQNAAVPITLVESTCIENSTTICTS
jgi:hypothetical protein